MNNIEGFGSKFEQIAAVTSIKEHNLENLDNNCLKRDITFSDKNSKAIIAVGGLVSGQLNNFDENKVKIEQALSRGANPVTVLRQASNDLNIDTKQIDAKSLSNSDSIKKMMFCLGNGDCFVYQNSGGELRVIFGAKPETYSIDGETRGKPNFCVYSGDGFVDDKTIKSELKNLISEGGSLTYVTEAKSMMQELVRPYDNSLSR